MKTLVYRTILAGVASALCATAVAQAPARPFQRETDTYLALLMQERYDELERAAQRARESSAAISDGQPLLAAIYGGTAGCMTQGCQNRLTDELWQVRRQKLEGWVKRHPASPTAKVALGMFHAEYAWFARGQGYSNTVGKDAWTLFRERLELARVALEQLDEATRQDPGWSAAMLDVGLAQRWPRDRFGALYEQAAQRHPYYLPIHFAASAYYSPRWYGSEAELRRFIERAVERTSPRWGEMLYARLNWSLWTQDMFEDGQTDWKRMSAGFERILRDHPDPWNLNNFARFACHAEDLKTAAGLIEKIGDKPLVAAWWNDLRHYERCRDRAGARK